MRSLTRFDRALAFAVVGVVAAGFSGSAMADIPTLPNFTMTLSATRVTKRSATGRTMTATG